MPRSHIMLALLVGPALGAAATRDLHAALARDVLELQRLLEPAGRPGEFERRNFIGEAGAEPHVHLHDGGNRATFTSARSHSHSTIWDGNGARVSAMKRALSAMWARVDVTRTGDAGAYEYTITPKDESGPAANCVTCMQYLKDPSRFLDVFEEWYSEHEDDDEATQTFEQTLLQRVASALASTKAQGTFIREGGRTITLYRPPVAIVYEEEESKAEVEEESKVDDSAASAVMHAPSSRVSGARPQDVYYVNYVWDGTISRLVPASSTGGRPNWASRDLRGPELVTAFIEAHIRGHTPTARNPLPLMEQDAVDYQRFLEVQNQCGDVMQGFYKSDGTPKDGYDDDTAELAYEAACVPPCIWDEDEDPMCQGGGFSRVGSRARDGRTLIDDR